MMGVKFNVENIETGEAINFLFFKLQERLFNLNGVTMENESATDLVKEAKQ